jgi:hypothetical protein
VRLLLLVLLTCVSSATSAQQLLRVVQPVWAGLTQPERDAIQQRYLIELVSPEIFGIIIDNQGVDESTAGSNAGSNLGIAVGGAAYIDKAFRDGNYSAKGQLGAMLLGGLVGAALDRPPESRFHYRYSVRTGDGNIQYIDAVSSEPFRHPVGVCVSLPIIALATDQQLCAQTLAGFRSSYLGTPLDGAAPVVSRGSPNNHVPAPLVSRTVELPLSDLVDCKPNSLAPIRTTAEKCKLINGKIIQ